MQFEVEVNGHIRQVKLTRREETFAVETGGRRWVVDAAQVGANMLSLLIEGDDGSQPDLPAPGVSIADAAVPPPAAIAGTATTLITSETAPRRVHSREIAMTTDPVTGRLQLAIGPHALVVGLDTRRRWGRKDEGATGSGPQRIVAPMPGKVVRILAGAGHTVAPRQPVIVIEAMKMENELRASRQGVVADVLVKEGQSVDAGTVLAIITPS